MSRLDVRKTYKLYIGGKFPRSESGRSYAVQSASGEFLANASMGSRKDVRDAVVAARGAFGGWAAATPYNRGQVLYRVAEVLEGRRAQFIDEVGAGEGLTARAAATVVDAAVDRVVWYAGWTDKIAQVLGNLNPVAGPYFNVSAPEPTGVVGVLAPQASSLLGLVSVVAPVIASGNTAVVVVVGTAPAARRDAGRGARHLRRARWRRQHRHGADRRGRARGSPRTATSTPSTSPGSPAPRASTGPVSRPRPPATSSACCVPRIEGGVPVEPDWTAAPGLERIRAFVETKTVWHPKGL